MNGIQAIETRYAGHLFRSRLEARWAAFFDLVGLQWEYEPFDAAGYIPDFLVQGGSLQQPPILIEVKPFLPGSAELRAEADRCFARTVGVMPIPLLAVGCALDFDKDGWGNTLAGAMRQLPFEYGPDEFPGNAFSGPYIYSCWGCGAVYFIDDGFSFGGCGGERAGGRACRTGECLRPSEAWGKAHELTRWVRR